MPGSLLVLDPNAEIRVLLAERFEEQGWTVAQAERYQDAAGQVVGGQIDVLVLDYVAGTKGALLLIRSLMSCREGALVVASIPPGDATAEAELEAAGVTTILTRPYLFRELLDLIESRPDATLPPRAGGDTDAVRLTVYTQVDPREIEAVKRLLLRNPQDHHAQWLLAFCYYRSGKFRDAIHLLEAILSGEGTNILARYYLGNCYYRSARYADCVRQWEAVLELDDDGPLVARTKKLLAYVHELQEAVASESNEDHV